MKPLSPKGEVSMMFFTGIVLAVVMILFSSGIFGKLAIFNFEPLPNQRARANFNEMTYVLHQAVEDSRDTLFIPNIPYYQPSGFLVVAHTVGEPENPDFVLPRTCDDETCLCLLDAEGWLSTSESKYKVMTCEQFRKDVVLRTDALRNWWVFSGNDVYRTRSYFGTLSVRKDTIYKHSVLYITT